MTFYPLRHFRRFERVPTLTLIAALALFIGLGNWQITRLHWKENLLARLEQAQAQEPLRDLPAGAEALRAEEFRSVRLLGTFLPEQSLYLGGRFRDGQGGYYLLTPFVLADDGRAVLVNRGFIPAKMRDAFESLENNGVLMAVEGLLRQPRHKRMFMPDNHPEENVWLWEDLPAMEKRIDLSLLPLVVEATGDVPADQYPKPGSGKIALRNDHFGYALTWYALALVAIGMFLAWHYQKPGES